MADHPFTIRQLEYFESVAVHGSLASAAAYCHVTPSGLAIAIDELEKNLGVQLFVRRKAKGVTLTETGRQLLSDARVLLGNAGTLAAHASRDGTGVGGRLSVGCYPTLSPFFLPGILEEFGRAHPALELEFVEASAPELHEHLVRGRIETALMYGADMSRDLAHDPVREYLPYALVGASHRLASIGHASLRELVDEPLIALDVPPSRQNTEHLFASIGLAPRIAHNSMNFELVRCLVGRGLGYSILFQKPLSAQTYDGHAVVAIELTERLQPSMVGLARPSGTRLTRRAKALLDFLRQAAPTELATRETWVTA